MKRTYSAVIFVITLDIRTLKVISNDLQFQGTNFVSTWIKVRFLVLNSFYTRFNTHLNQRFRNVHAPVIIVHSLFSSVELESSLSRLWKSLRAKRHDRVLARSIFNQQVHHSNIFFWFMSHTNTARIRNV